jgi:hypothetical protein
MSHYQKNQASWNWIFCKRVAFKEIEFLSAVLLNPYNKKGFCKLLD